MYIQTNIHTESCNCRLSHIHHGLLCAMAILWTAAAALAFFVVSAAFKLQMCVYMYICVCAYIGRKKLSIALEIAQRSEMENFMCRSKFLFDNCFVSFLPVMP